MCALGIVGVAQNEPSSEPCRYVDFARLGGADLARSRARVCDLVKPSCDFIRGMESEIVKRSFDNVRNGRGMNDCVCSQLKVDLEGLIS